jgi:hypothetical protein
VAAFSAQGCLESRIAKPFETSQRWTATDRADADRGKEKEYVTDGGLRRRQMSANIFTLTRRGVFD